MKQFNPPNSAMQKWDRDISAAAKKEESNEIAILSEIGPAEWGGIDAKTVKARLDAIGKKDVVVLLNTPGGDAFEGIAIYNLLREHKGRVTVAVLGLAASAGSIIAMAGDQIRMHEASQLMIHSAWGLVAGNKNDLREFADTLDKMDAAMAGLYASRTGIPADKVKAMMDAETWMSAEEAVEAKFADIIVADEKKKKNYSARAEAVIAVEVMNAVSAMRAAGKVAAVSMSVKRPNAIDVLSIKSAASRATHGAHGLRRVAPAGNGSPAAAGHRNILLPE